MGDAWELVTCVPEIETGARFYQRLGFRRLADRTRPYRAARLTDGSIVVALRREPGPVLSLHLGVAADATDRATPPLGPPSGSDASDRRAGGARRLRDPSGHVVEVIRSGERPGTLGPRSTSFGPLGEISLEVDDLDAAARFWERLGFRCVPVRPPDFRSLELDAGGRSPTPIALGVYRRGYLEHALEGPALTYFVPELDPHVAELSRAGVRFTLRKDPSGGREVRMRAPGGQLLILCGS